MVGGLSPPRAVEKPRDEPLSTWQRYKKRISTWLDEWLRRPDVEFEDLPSDITERRDEMIVDVLAGEPRSDTRRSIDKKVRIVMAGHPIYVGNSILGAVVVEQSSYSILRSQYELPQKHRERKPDGVCVYNPRFDCVRLAFDGFV